MTTSMENDSSKSCDETHLSILHTYNAPSNHSVRDSSDLRNGRWRIDVFVLGFLMLMFVLLQFDRTNLGNALTDNFAQYIGIDQKQINIGQTLFTLAIVIFELPSNVVLKKVGPHIWLPFIVVIWGAVTLSQAWIKDRKSFYATRFLLAMGEAGFIPGSAYYIGRFYMRNELGLRYSLLWSSNAIAGAIGGVLALAILSLNGSCGLHGYQWLFIIEGSMTIFVALVAAIYLPRDIASATTWRFLPKKSKKALPTIITSKQAVQLIEATKKDDATPRSKLKWSDFDCFLDWKLPGHCIMAFLSSIMFTPVNTYAPSIIKSLGFKGYTANGLNSVGSVLALIISLSLGWSSDRFNERAIHIVVGFVLSGIGLLWLALPPEGTAKGILYAGVVITQGGMGTVQGINAAWLSNNLQERQKPIALAAYAMSIQLASFVGSNLFRAKDAPRYRRGLIICAVCVLVAAVFALVWKILYRLRSYRESSRHQVQTPENEKVGDRGHDIA